MPLWEGDPEKCPSVLITLASTDGEDGLMWKTFEDFWVEYGLYPGGLDAKALLSALLEHILLNQKGEWVLSEQERHALIEKLTVPAS